ncbi:MAG: hypothetical protein FD144_2155 [Rhodospirillaceae bacterium]|nr:MAG: hypothetical protein FD144_2155 [Rhodospirillaceae bacterium]
MPADDPASPACLAHEADDPYMGFATREEIVQFMADLDAAPGNRRADLLRMMLPRIRDDVLHAELSARLAAITDLESPT